MLNLANAVEAVCGPSAELAGRVIAEGRAALDAAGIEAVTAEEDRARRGDLLRIRPIAGERRGGGSSWQSLARGAATVETDHLNGEIVLLGRLHGVATPANEVLQRLANAMARSGAQPATMPEPDVLREVEERTVAVDRH